MKLSYKVINNNLFMQALKSLEGQRMPGKVAYDVAKILRSVQKIVDEAKPEFKKIMEQVAVKDEKNQFVPSDDGHGIKIKEDCWQKYEELMEEFLSKEVEIDSKPLWVGHLEHTSLSPSEIEALLPILTEVHVVQ